MSTIDLTLKIWRQKNNDSLGNFETYILRDITTDMSFLEMLDVLNEQLTKQGKEPVDLIMTAGKASAACAALLLTGSPMDRKKK